MKLKSNYALIDIIVGQRKLAKRLAQGEPIVLNVTMTLDMDERNQSDDGTSIEFVGYVTEVHEV